jgi:8-oxo-dGTP pyrophosphatase MutT (NUDIX family)
VILAPAQDPAVLLLKRAVRAGDRWSGHIGLPGGRRDPGDGDLLATAVRETREETGLRLTPADLLGELDDLGPRAAGAPQIAVRPFVFGLSRRLPVEPCTEVAGHFWFPLGELRAHGVREVDVPEMPRKVRAYLFGEHVIWGLTHRILEQLLERLV